MTETTSMQEQADAIVTNLMHQMGDGNVVVIQREDFFKLPAVRNFKTPCSPMEHSLRSQVTYAARRAKIKVVFDDDLRRITATKDECTETKT